MESYLNSKSQKALFEIINFIKNSDEYIRCSELKNRMGNDQMLLSLIDDVKKLQKKYIQSGYDERVLGELDLKLDLLNQNRDYVEYNYYLQQVNKMILLVKDELNQYFSEIVNVDF